jgi:LCP family protein required for cell wall assembly
MGSVFLLLFVVAIVVLGYITFNAVKNVISGLPVGTGSGPQIGGDESSTPLPGELPETLSPWSGNERINILLLGIDERQDQDGPWRTDTMIVLTLDPAAMTAGMISIPRDLWVEIPGYGNDRINKAFFLGDADRYPGGGPALAMRTVQHNLGIPIHHYVTINFGAFVTLIDQIGCIEVDVPEAINDPDYPAAAGFGYDPFYIDAGHHTLCGEDALRYARTRATFGGDFDRAARQQQVIYAIRDRVLSSGQLPQLIGQAPELWNTLQDGVSTSLSLQQVIQLALLAQDIPDSNICSAVIDGQYVDMVTLSDGSQVLVPDHDSIRELVLEIFSGTGSCNIAQRSLADGALSENATVSVVNGTLTEGLATTTGDYLAASGINVVNVGNADRFDYEHTAIYDYTGQTNTASYLAMLLSVPETAIVRTENPAGLYDIQVVLGNDYTP